MNFNSHLILQPLATLKLPAAACQEATVTAQPTNSEQDTRFIMNASIATLIRPGRSLTTILQSCCWQI